MSVVWVGKHVISAYVLLYLPGSRMSSEFLAAVTVLGDEFWDDFSCSAVEIYNLFERPCCLSILIVEVWAIWAKRATRKPYESGDQ
jgi:hypothetical protein